MKKNLLWTVGLLVGLVGAPQIALGQDASETVTSDPGAASGALRSLADAVRDLSEAGIAYVCESAAAECSALSEQLGVEPLPSPDKFELAVAATMYRAVRTASIADAGKPALSPEMQTRLAKVHKVLENFREQPLNTGKQGSWEIMHRIVAFGVDTEIRRDGPTGPKVNAIGWLLHGGRSNGEPLMLLNGSQPYCRVGPGVQGHPGQFLGMLAQSHVMADSPFELGGKSFTVADLIEQEKLDCNSRMELTFKLIALSYYLKSDDVWTTREGETWSIPRLIQEEIRQPLHGAACGGTHRLFGLSSSFLMRAKQGLPIDGEYERAQTYIRDYQRYTLGNLQNSDGSMSTDWFNHPADAPDIARKVQTTGHILEWLVFSLPDAQLRDPRVEKSVDFLADTLGDSPDKEWSIGPLGHALHALAIYEKRIEREEKSSAMPKFARKEPVKTALRELAPAAPPVTMAVPPAENATVPAPDITSVPYQPSQSGRTATGPRSSHSRSPEAKAKRFDGPSFRRMQ